MPSSRGWLVAGGGGGQEECGGGSVQGLSQVWVSFYGVGSEHTEFAVLLLFPPQTPVGPAVGGTTRAGGPSAVNGETGSRAAGPVRVTRAQALGFT